VTGHARSPLFLVPDDQDQVGRLNQFRAGHPSIKIHAGQGYWQAQIPQHNGEQVITRYQLKDLLDKLDTLTGKPMDRDQA
jgi:hypothetical protein